MKDDKILIPDENIQDYSLPYEENKKKEEEYRKKVNKAMEKLTKQPNSYLRRIV